MTIQQESGNSMSGSGNTPRGSSEPQGLLYRSAYLIPKFQSRKSCEILDPDTREKIGLVKDESGNALTVFGNQNVMRIYDNSEHPPVLTIRRETSRKVLVSTGDGSSLGYFRGPGPSGGRVAILDAREQQVGKIGGWDERNPKPKLKFLDMPPIYIFTNGRRIGTCQPYWRKDTLVTLNEEMPASFFERAMLLASNFAAGMIRSRVETPV